MSEVKWPSEWHRGVLGPAVLSIISEGETYGYVIAQRLERSGLGTVKGGTLYPLLSRYESDGLLQAMWREGDGGPGRKFFSLTTRGQDELSGLRESWHRFSRIAGALIDGESEER
ncbi:PadR family transcriptional regulator [Luethyella okanaganae]|uniref:PadR family transcriptional regulator n=1 Tax=Luethyella okanaganae TaxID=69372 RepID=A0ABW1VGV4_9MICO